MLNLYKCLRCGKDVSLEDVRKRVRCPYCGYRILIKKRAPIERKVKAR
ncbi:MAG: DNA-directed RNA polymerase subunit P [Candidatus Aenigmarchaeota archaeon]|nr:DNA-directed RNA polymerase subunit P [Candidatus Aenigmarchaeota archaeon]